MSTQGRAARVPGLVRISGVYLVLQGLTAGLWWLAMAASAPVRARFELSPADASVLNAYLFADLVVVVGASASSGFALLRGSRHATVLVAFTAGGVWYATLELAGWALDTGSGHLGLAVMTVAAIVTTLVCLLAMRELR
jgi:hypothetical protein